MINLLKQMTKIRYNKHTKTYKYFNKILLIFKIQMIKMMILNN